MKRTQRVLFRTFLPIFAALLGLASCGGFSSSKRGQSSPPDTNTQYAPSGAQSYGDSTMDSTESAGPPERVATSSHRGSIKPSYDSPSPSSQRETIANDRQERPGLGTKFGEQRNSKVSTRRFERARNQPFASIALHYNSREGIQAQAWTRGMNLRELRAQSANGGISISLVDESGRLLDGGSGGGRTYVVGQDGQRYTLQIRNDTGGSYEVVTSVDGLDVIDGKPANMSKRGYIVAPYSTLSIDGFRTSTHSVAAFRFGSVSNSYAAQTSGDRNVGVIGFAFFAERGSRWTSDEIRRRETANPFPGGFSAPPGMAR